jgi:Tfp pilus assembly protein PilF
VLVPSFGFRVSGFLRISAFGFRASYLLSLIFFVVGLMSKPMLVTWPFVMLLLDYWPLERFKTAGVRRLVMEKIPFFALAGAAGVVTFLVQQKGGAVASVGALSLSSRVGNALISYVRYLGMMIWPEKLAALYLRDREWPVWWVTGAALLLLAVTVLVFRTASRRGYLATGWLWYLGTLVPVIGLVQVGRQAMADRYTYLPLIGIFIVVAWGGWELATAWRTPKLAVGAVAGAALIGCMALTEFQLGFWTNTEALYKRMIAVSDRNYVAHSNLGIYYADRNQLAQAIFHSQSALDISPNYANAHINLGSVLAKQRRFDEAVQHYQAALRVASDQVDACRACNGLGTCYAMQNRLDEAARCFKEALRFGPNNSQAHNNLGNVLAMQRKWEEAMRQFLAAIDSDPLDAQAHFNLGLSLQQQGKQAEAVKHFQVALRLNPNYTEAQKALQLLPSGK